MKEYPLTYSIIKPPAIEVTETKVFVAEDIQQVTLIDENDIEKEYFQYKLIEYNINEYLIKQQNTIDELQEELSAAKILLGVE